MHSQSVFKVKDIFLFFSFSDIGKKLVLCIGSQNTISVNVWRHICCYLKFMLNKSSSRYKDTGKMNLGVSCPSHRGQRFRKCDWTISYAILGGTVLEGVKDPIELFEAQKRINSRIFKKQKGNVKLNWNNRNS